MADELEADPRRLRWREALLDRLLLALTPITAAAMLMALVGTHGRNRGALMFIVPLVVLQAAAALRPRWPHWMRVACLLAPLLLTTLQVYLLVGFVGNASVIAASAVVLTGLLFSRREVAMLLGVLLLTVVGVGWARVSGKLMSNEGVDFSTARAMPWVRTTFVSFSTWTVLGLAITFVVQRIEGELVRTRDALTRLREEQARRMKAEAERRVAEEAALQAQKIELIGRLAAGVAHDFNNVLGVVTGWADLSLEEGASRVDREQGREAIKSAIQQGKALTRQLLALSRRDARFVSRFALERSIKSGVTTLGRVLPPNIKLSFDGREQAQVNADENELQQVLFNLVLNARDAMPEGGQIEVRTGVVSLAAALAVIGGELGAGRWALLSVKDSGAGVDPAVRERIFELFFTTKPIGFGTGLGLATVLRIAQASGGGITLDSIPGQGATFALYLPCADQAP